MSLQSYVDSFRIVGPAGNIVSGTPIEFAAVADEILDIPTTEVVTAPVDLQFVIKHLQLVAVTGENPWPHAAVAGVVASITSGLSKAPAGATPADKMLEAWAGTLSGTVPVGLRDISETVRVDYAWEVIVEPRVFEGVDPFAVVAGSLASPSLTIAVPPIIQDMEGDSFEDSLDTMEAAAKLSVRLTVTARVGTSQTASFTTPPLSLPILPIPVPKVAALFSGADFGGDRAMVMVPAGSKIGSVQELMAILAPLQNLTGKVKAAAGLTAWAVGASALADTVGALAERVPLTQSVAFRERDEYDNLGNDNFVDGFPWDHDIEDEASSALILAGSQTISFFQHDDFEGERLTLVPAIDGTPNRLGAALVRHLHFPFPQSEPPGCVNQSGTPGGGHWGNAISSYRWSHPFSG